MPSNEVTVLPEAGRPDTTKTLALAGGLNLEEIKSIGTVFFQSGMFRDTKSAAQAITKVMAGQELGVPPMQSMRGIHVVDGNPQLSAGLIAALVKRSVKYDYRIVTLDDEMCELEWTENGTVVGTSKFTLEQAKKIPGKDGKKLADKDNWRNYGEDMLFARALTRGARRHAPDVFGGAVYAVGEPVPEQEDLPRPMIQQTPQGGYVPPRVATLHEGSEESRSASSSPEGAAHTEDAPASASPSGTELFPPSEEEIAALEADQHRDPTDGDA